MIGIDHLSNESALQDPTVKMPQSGGEHTI